MTRTIDVTGDFLVGRNDELQFNSEPAFRFMAGETPPQLICAGSVVARGSDVNMWGVITDDDALDAVGAGVVLRQGSSFTVRSTGGSATGFSLLMNEAHFINAGDVKINAGVYAIGLSMDGDGAVARNSGRFEASAKLATTAMNFGMSSDLVNSGEIIAIAKQEGANAVIMSADAHFKNTGLVKVDAELGAIGVQMASGADFDSDGRVLVTSHNSGGIGMSVFGSVSIHNAGDVIVRSLDVALGIILGGDTELLNDGRIVAVDTGEIGRSIAIWGAGAEMHIVNTGLIQSEDAIFNPDGEVGIAVDNSGKIRGDVTLNAGADVLHNSGAIHGVVALGGGDDSFDGGAGKLSGEVLGGDGDDLLVLGRTDDLISGGAGSDTMTGGAGSDTFVFTDVADSHGGTADVITDIGRGDAIDLSAIDADTAQDGDQGFHLVDQLGGNAGELVVAYNAKQDVTLVLGDTDGDGQADLRIALEGNHAGFDSFVL